MATRFINKPASVSSITNYQNAAGVGFYGGLFYINNGGGAVPVNGPFTLRNVRVVDATNFTATNGLYQTIASAVAAAVSGDVIILAPGDYSETNISTVVGVKWVTVIGTGGVERSTRWRDTGNAATPFITVNDNGWAFHNIYFAGGTAASSIYLSRTATSNANETQIYHCVFNGGSCAIELNGSPSNIIIKGCRFVNVRGGTATQTGAIVCTGTAQAVSTNLVIEGNEFYDCDYNIHASMSRSMVKNNYIQGIGHDGAATQVINLAANSGQGTYNMVLNNFLGKANANYNNAGGFKSDANTPWVNNYANDQIVNSASGVTA